MGLVAKADLKGYLTDSQILFQQTAVTVLLPNAFAASALQFKQVALPYAYDALEPHIDATTMEIHYTKHHTAYIKNVNDAIAAAKLTYVDEQTFFANAYNLSAKARNNGGGARNHNFFWKSRQPSANTSVPGPKV